MDSAQNRGTHLFGKTANKRLSEKMSSLDTQEMFPLDTQEMSSLETQEMSSLETQEMSSLETHLWVTPMTQNS